MELSERIKTLRAEKHLTLEQVGTFVGVGKSTVRKWENGIIANMKRDKIAKLAKCFNVSPSYLMGWEDNIYDNIYPIQTQKVKMLGEIACGNPIWCEEERESYVTVGTQIKADFCLKCKGDSMVGARINDGDIVFIHQQDTVENGEIAAVIIDNEATLKRVYYSPETAKLVLQAENPKYMPLVYVGQELEQIHILGKAIAFQSDII